MNNTQVVKKILNRIHRIRDELTEIETLLTTNASNPTITKKSIGCLIVETLRLMNRTMSSLEIADHIRQTYKKKTWADVVSALGPLQKNGIVKSKTVPGPSNAPIRVYTLI